MTNKIILTVNVILILAGCHRNTKSEKTTAFADRVSPLKLTMEQASRLSRLPFDCINTEFPNKLLQVLAGKEDLKAPCVLHPAFCGCFDWHSSVHGHWSLITLLKLFPGLVHKDSIISKLRSDISEKNILQEVKYFQGKYNKSYERTYGWAWLLKLAEGIHTWDTPLARQLEQNLQPLTDLIVLKFEEYLPKLNYPIRVGTHTNTAFALSFARDYAVVLDDKNLLSLIDKRARAFYAGDKNCPIDWEPGGQDFLSPCLEEAALMRRVLSDREFEQWIALFLPQLTDEHYAITPGEVSDRTDGHLVHLDGYNFSRAWNLSIISRGFPRYAHLNSDANRLILYSLPHIFNDDYMGSHWLGTFALLAMIDSDAAE